MSENHPVDFQRLTVREEDGVTIIGCVDSRVQDQELVQQWTEELNQLVEEKDGMLVVMNLDNVQFLASAALNKLVVLNRTLKKRGGTFVLCDVEGPIRDMFSVTNLDRLLPLADSEVDAIALCKAQAE